jgi:hypothetical protein
MPEKLSHEVGDKQFFTQERDGDKIQVWEECSSKEQKNYFMSNRIIYVHFDNFSL